MKRFVISLLLSVLCASCFEALAQRVTDSSYRTIGHADGIPLICGAQEAPQGRLVYCSYSCTGAAGLGKDYCELVADPGTAPKVVVALKQGNRFGEPEIRAEYPVAPEVVDSLQAGLAERNVHRLNGYLVEEAILGGYTYRIYQEYDSGEKVNASWYGHNIKEEAWAAYNYIATFFAPWRKQAQDQ